MIALWATVAWGGDVGLERALHALHDEFEIGENRATEVELRADYAAACRRGWRPACAPAAWRVAGERDVARLREVLEPECGQGDALACTVLGWHGGGPIGVDELLPICDRGFAPACTAAAGIVMGVEGDVPRGTALYEKACRGVPEPADARIPTDPLACGFLGQVDDDPAKLETACLAEDGSSCAVWAPMAADPAEQRRRLQLGCDGGFAASCLDFATDLGRDLPPDETTVDRVPDPADAELRADRHAAHVRACALGFGRGCTEAARDQRDGRGVPVDVTAANDAFWDACQGYDGAGCAALADAIVEGEAEGFGVPARALYQRGCDAGYGGACRSLKRFDRDQRFRLRQLAGRGYVRSVIFATARPWTGGTFGFTAAIALPKVDTITPRRRFTITLDQGAGDFTLGVLDRRETPENVSSFALDWRQDGTAEKPRAVLLAAGTQLWQGLPRFSDEALVTAVPGEATQTLDLATAVVRADIERTTLFGPRTGLGVSLAGMSGTRTDGDTASEGQVGRAVVSVRRRPQNTLPLPMQTSSSELSGYIGGTINSPDADGVHGGAWFRDQRALLLIRTAGQRPTLSLVTDVVAGVRQGAVPFWLEHHHVPHFAPNLGNWQLLRGQPAALMRGDVPVRARAGLRWWVGEYHGLRRHLGFYVSPFIEAGAAIPNVQALDEAQWRSDGGLSATLTLRRRTAFHLEALIVSDLESGGYTLAPSLILQQLVDPWD